MENKDQLGNDNNSENQNNSSSEFRISHIAIQIGSTVATAFLSGLAMSAGAAAFNRLTNIKSKTSLRTSEADSEKVLAFAKNS